MASDISFLSYTYKVAEVLSILAGAWGFFKSGWGLAILVGPLLWKGGATLLRKIRMAQPIRLWEPSWKLIGLVWGIVVLFIAANMIRGHFYGQNTAEPFASVYTDPTIMNELGSCLTKAAPVLMSEQFFQHGLMLWRKDHWDIYALDNNQRWTLYYDPSFLYPPEEDSSIGPCKIVGGFKVAWNKYREIQETLGTCTAAAEEGFPSYIQQCEHGVLIGPVSRGPAQSCHDSHCLIYALIEKGKLATGQATGEYKIRDPLSK